MKKLLFVILLFPFVSAAQDFSTIGFFSDLLIKSPKQIDSLLNKKGFKQEGIVGLTFTYKSPQETINYTSFPKSIEFITNDKAKYFSLNADNVQAGSGFVKSDTQIIQNLRIPVSNFRLNDLNLRFGTYVMPQTKKTIYVFVISQDPPAPKKADVLESTNPTSTDSSNLLATSVLNSITKSKIDKKTDNTSPKNNKSSIPYEPKAGDISINKYIWSGGIGLYNYIHFRDPISPVSEETAIALNIGVEMSEDKLMRRSGQFNTVTKAAINLTSFTGMQHFYPTGLTESYAQTLFLSKHFLTAGFSPELRIKDESLALHLGSGVNWTRGRLSGNDETASFFTLALRTGIYFKHYFRNQSKNRDLIHTKIGFEQCFSQKGGYIGQFFIGFGI